jgi:hypothetical protein
MNAGVNKMEWSEATAPSGGPPTTTPGTLSVSGGTTARYLVGGSLNTKASLLADLVPSVADTVNGFGLNPGDGYLYFVSSIDTGGNDTSGGGYKWSDDKVFLSAVSFTFGPLSADSAATIVDLDPNSANKYLEIQWTKPSHADGTASAPGAELLGASDLAFSPDGAQLYVSNATADRVFIFNIDAVPEPASIGLLALGGLTLVRRRQRALSLTSKR